ncbi:MAG: GTP 3',8-cyclase MoaA, partial [Actinomycetota bacterium]
MLEQPAAGPLEGPLVDTFGRVADDLRVSVTDRCNFRCTYCMPAEGLQWLPKTELLTFEELTRLAALFVRLGVRSIKVTGGEPTVRADLPALVRMLRGAGPGLDISITTNGLLLDTLAAPLAEAGIDRATVSCDSLLQHRFAEMTRRDALDRVLRGLRAAEEAGLTPIKINTVVIGGTNDDELVDFARWARETGYEIR